MMLALATVSSFMSDPAVDTASQHVLGTVFWAGDTGTLTWTSCTLIAHHLGGVYAEGSCVPYSVIAALVAAKMHAFSFGGYTPAELNVIRQMPVRSPELLLMGVSRAWETVRNVVLNHRQGTAVDHTLQS